MTNEELLAAMKTMLDASQAETKATFDTSLAGVEARLSAKIDSVRDELRTEFNTKLESVYNRLHGEIEALSRRVSNDDQTVMNAAIEVSRDVRSVKKTVEKIEQQIERELRPLAQEARRRSLAAQADASLALSNDEEADRRIELLERRVREIDAEMAAKA